jgi:site-specific recombinase XerD
MKLRRMGYTTTDAEGRKSKEKSAKWYGVFMDFNGVLRRLPLFEDRGASKTLADNIDRLNSLRSANEKTLPPELAEAVDMMPSGILAKLAAWDIIPSEKAATTKPLSEHVQDWKAALLAKGNTPQHAGTSAGHVQRIVTGLGLATVADVSASRVQSFLAGLQNDRKDVKGKIHRGISKTTFNYHLRDAKGFFKWMVEDRRASTNPLKLLKGGKKAKTDKRHVRRALSIDELRLLLDTTSAGPDRYGMSGADRAMLYRLAAETGLRSSELRSLTRASFHLGDDPSVTIDAAYAKNRRQDTLPLKPDTAATLALHFTGKMPAAMAFVMQSRIGSST